MLHSGKKMDITAIFLKFADFYSAAVPLITAMSNLSNTYGSFRRVPISKFKPHCEKLYMLYKENISLYKDIYAVYKDICMDSIYFTIIRDMLIVFNSIFILLWYFGYDIER